MNDCDSGPSGASSRLGNSDIAVVGGLPAQLQRATADGVPVQGCFQGSTMDNFEWTAGFGNRCGLVYVEK